MNRKATKAQIKQLKSQLKTANHESDAHLLKMTVVMLLLLLTVAIIYDIQMFTLY